MQLSIPSCLLSNRLVKGQYVSAEGDVISHVNISSVHVADGGTYTCTAANTAGEASHAARLNVYGPPQVRPMGQQTAVAGRTFIISCPASGHPIHSITWSKGERWNGCLLFYIFVSDCGNCHYNIYFVT